MKYKNAFDNTNTNKVKIVLLIGLIITIMSVAIFFIFLYDPKPSIFVDYKTKYYEVTFTEGDTVASLLYKNNLLFDDDDIVKLDSEEFVHNKLDSIPANDVKEIQIIDVEIKTEVEKEMLEFSTVIKEDGELPLNEIVVDTVGLNGEKQVVYERTYHNYKLVDEVIVNEVELQVKVDEIKRIGTKQPVTEPNYQPNSNGAGGSNNGTNTSGGSSNGGGSSSGGGSNPTPTPTPVVPATKIGVFNNLTECQTYGNSNYKTYSCIALSDGSYNIVGQK